MTEVPDLGHQPPPRPVGAAPLVITGTAQHSAWQARVLPPVEQVRPGLWSIPVPIPNSPLRYVSVYVIELPDGVAIVDTGWPDEEAWDCLVTGLTDTGHAITDVRGILITHAHHDHHGLSTRVREASGAWIGMHPAEAVTMRQHTQGQVSFGQQMQRWATQRGGDETEADAVHRHFADHPRLEPMATPDVMIEDGGLPLGPVGAIRAIWTPGHTPGHLCYVHQGYDLLLTGDHILPRISPNISMNARTPGDPLRDYLASLALIAKHEAVEVLPAHEYRFSGLATRAYDLLQHHYNRLNEITHLITEQPHITTWAIAEQLTWSRSWAETTGPHRINAVSETLAHLVYLQNNQHIRNVGTVTDSWTLTLAGSRVD
jgi:glyoxylase-like metal-dependent hydrolase (beta-lactamase superfamily II)